MTASWLVTGGCGFIGSHLVEALLRRGERVRILDDLSTGRRHDVLAGAEIIVGDVADPVAVARAMDGVDGCFHLAAIASVQRCNEDWLGTHRTNLTGAITVFDAARTARRDAPVPVVYASSAAVFGDNPETPLAETATLRPLSAYGADKLGCELHGRVAWNVHGVPTTGLQFFNVYGPRQDPSSPYSGVIAIFADRIADGRTVEILATGSSFAISSLSATSSPISSPPWPRRARARACSMFARAARHRCCSWPTSSGASSASSRPSSIGRHAMATFACRSAVLMPRQPRSK